MTNKVNYKQLLPVMFGFFIMGFVDVVGISTNYVKRDFELSDTLANMLPMMVFAWFFVFSVPTGMMMNKIGRKKTVILSMVLTLVAMLIPLIVYSFEVILVAFALLGIGNTLLQVSLNPLLSNIVSGERLTSSLTFGQFVKALASFAGPIIAGFAASAFGNWKMLFPLFAIITLLSTLWLLSVKIEETHKVSETTSIGRSLGLLKDINILVLFLGILFVVGVDVGLNTTVPKLLMERTTLALERAGLGTSLYFIARTAGTFLGAMLLVKYSGRKIYTGGIMLSLASMIIMFFVSNLWVLLILIFIIGFSIANVFSIIFSSAIRLRPDATNEVSGLMIMGVSGGAIFLPIMGLASDKMGGTQVGALIVLFLSLVYLLYGSTRLKD